MLSSRPVSTLRKIRNTQLSLELEKLKSGFLNAEFNGHYGYQLKLESAVTTLSEVLKIILQIDLLITRTKLRICQIDVLMHNVICNVYSSLQGQHDPLLATYV